MSDFEKDMAISVERLKLKIRTETVCDLLKMKAIDEKAANYWFAKYQEVFISRHDSIMNNKDNSKQNTVNVHIDMSSEHHFTSDNIKNIVEQVNNGSR